MNAKHRTKQKITCTSIRIAKFVTEEGMRKKIFLFAAGSLGKKIHPAGAPETKLFLFLAS